MTESTEAAPAPRPEKLLPQASLKFFMLLIGGSAIVMVIFRLALTQDVYWARIAALLFSITFACFASYFVLFVLANLFAASTRPLRTVLGYGVEPSGAAPGPAPAPDQTTVMEPRSAQAEER
jgi:hypothetical protein